MFVEDVLRSIIKQDYFDYEVILVDDGSIDNSLEVIRSFSKLYPSLNLKLICQENSGQASAVARGLSEANGDIIGWINSDDSYCENAFDRISRIFSQNKDADVVFGNINVVDIEGEHIFTLKHFKFSYVLSVFTGFANNMSNNAVFWRRHSYEELISLNPKYRCGLDNEFFSRLTLKKNVIHINETLANFRKQYVSKAAIGDNNWLQLMNDETHRVFEQSYQNIAISKFISSRLAEKAKICFVIYKRVLKVITGRYFNIFLEKMRYKQKSAVKIFML